MTPAPLYTQRAPTPPPKTFTHRGKYFSIAWKNRQKLFHTVEKSPLTFPYRGKYISIAWKIPKKLFHPVEKLPAPSPDLCPLTSDLPPAPSPDLCPLPSDLSPDLCPLTSAPSLPNPEPRTLNPSSHAA